MKEEKTNFEELEKLIKQQKQLDILEAHYIRLFDGGIVEISANGYTHTLSEEVTKEIRMKLDDRLCEKRENITKEISKYSVTKEG